MQRHSSRWIKVAAILGVISGCGPEATTVDSQGPEDEFETNYSALVPQQLTGTDPTGNVGNRNPTFIWTDNDPANCDRFRIWINDGLTTPRVDVTLDRTDPQIDCVGGECTYTSATALAAGNGRFWVRGVHLVDGPGPWSAGLSFSIGLNIQVATTAPTGNITVTTPQYRWTGNALADFYRLSVRNTDTGVEVINQEFTTAQALCATGTNCRVTPGTALGFGNYQFWVQTNRGGRWSNPRAFRVNPGTALTAPTLIAPIGGAITTNMPMFSWNAVANADAYDLWINDTTASPVSNTIISAAAAGCGGGGTCTVNSPVMLATGAARWWVRARGGSLVGPWSATGNFNVQ